MSHDIHTVTRQRIRHGNSAFLVEVSFDEDGFRGEWTCATCGQGGASAAKYGTADAAGVWANMAANVHCSVVHTPL